jgi:hypothetical protein
MSGTPETGWEGWEAHEERTEKEVDYVEGVLWFREPPEEGLDAVGGGTEITTPKGRKVTVGVPPGEVTLEGRVVLGRIADGIIDNVEERMAGSDTVEQMQWVNTIAHAMRAYVSGEDQQLIWKVATILLDYERAVKKAEEKGYITQEWTLRELIDLLPVNDPPVTPPGGE